MPADGVRLIGQNGAGVYWPARAVRFERGETRFSRTKRARRETWLDRGQAAAGVERDQAVGRAAVFGDETIQLGRARKGKRGLPFFRASLNFPPFCEIETHLRG